MVYRPAPAQGEEEIEEILEQNRKELDQYQSILSKAEEFQKSVRWILGMPTYSMKAIDVYHELALRDIKLEAALTALRTAREIIATFHVHKSDPDEFEAEGIATVGKVRAALSAIDKVLGGEK